MAVDVDAPNTELSDVSVHSVDSDSSTNDSENSSIDGDLTEQAGTAKQGRSRFSVRTALLLGLVIIATLAGLVGWLAYDLHETRSGMQLRERILQFGRQAGLDLTTIDHSTVESDVGRILGSTVGQFHVDFQQRSASFIDVIRKTESTSVGTIAESGLESFRGNEAQVLLAVQVKTSTKAAPEQPPVAWRMRIYIQRMGDDLKVSDVRFVS